MVAMRTTKTNDLFVSIEDVLAPVLAAVFVVLLGAIVLHFHPSLSGTMAENGTRFPLHNGRHPT